MKTTYTILIALSLTVSLTGCFEQKLDPGAFGTATAATDRGVLDPTVTWLGAGNYTDVDLAALPASKVCSDKSIFGTIGTAVCASAPSALDVTAAFVSGNYSSIASAPAASTYRSSVTLFGTVGTMAEPASHASTNSTSNSTTVTLTPQLGYWDGSRTVSIADAALLSSNIKASTTILGVAGSASVVDTASGDAVAGNILSGKKAFVNGALVTGSATDHGAINLGTTAIPGSGGFFSSIVLSLTTSDVCLGKSIFGSLGTMACGLASRAHRDIGSVTERIVPIVNKDHDGFSERLGTRGGAAASADPDNTIAFADTSGIVTCGNTHATVALRIANCNYSWDGATLGNSGEGKWNLVTKVNGKEVWQDERTGMLWGDNMGANNWCQAVGNIENTSEPAHPWGAWAINCTPGAGSGLQPASPVSMCAEVGGFNSDGFDDQKGGMRLAATGSSPSVAWRVPSRSDFLQAYANGAGYVMNTFRDGNNYWSSSVYSYYRYYAWVFVAYFDGGMYLNSDSRDVNGYSVRCVGR